MSPNDEHVYPAICMRKSFNSNPMKSFPSIESVSNKKGNRVYGIDGKAINFQSLNRVPNGVYIFRISNNTITRKLIINK
jgi:hypothetical protein